MIHLAGNFVKVGHFVIQRCLLCGAELAFDDLRGLAVCGEDDGYLPLVVGGLYEVTEGFPKSTMLVEETESPKIVDPEIIKKLCVSERVSS